MSDKSDREAGSKLSNGLLLNHAYSMTKVTETRSGQRLVRLRNPWGTVEWLGAWSPHSAEWNLLPKQEVWALEGGNGNGEFWMSFEEFKEQFNSIDMCHLTAESLNRTYTTINPEEKQVMQWKSSLFFGQWLSGVSAGGGIEYGEFMHATQCTRDRPVTPQTASFRTRSTTSRCLAPTPSATCSCS